jgi:UDP-glucose 4-epimerase
MERIVETVGIGVEPDFGALPERPLEIVQAADVERTKHLLGWQPRRTLTEGLRSTVDWYRAELERDERSVQSHPAGEGPRQRQPSPDSSRGG